MSSGFFEPQLELALPTETSASVSSDSLTPAQEERRYRRILARKQQQGDLAGMAACYIRLGDIMLSRGDSEEAGELYREALALSREAHERRQARARS